MKTVNLIYYNNGVGLVKDSQIIKDTLNSIDNSYSFYDFDAYRTDCPQADINVFLQNIDSNTIQFISKAKRNVLIPNLEWMSQYSLDHLDKIDCILTKSKEAKEILNKYHNNVIYVGFSSIDRWIPSTKKTKEFLHFSGKSIQKYTELVVDVFSEFKRPITIVDATGQFKGKTSDNITYIPKFISEEEVNKLFNSHKVHICCSLAEGWGHYIYEALSCKSIVIVNDCAPENELLKDTAFLVKTTKTPSIQSLRFFEDKEFPLRKVNYTDRKDFIKTIRNLDFISDFQIQSIGEKSRNSYIDIHKSFKKNIKLS